MDLDTTIKGFDLSHSNIRQIFSEICEIPIKDNVIFEILDTNEIREADEYPGIRVSLSASYPPMKIPIKADVTTGDVITPGEIEYSFPLMFGNKKINILAYNIETMLAEKIKQSCPAVLPTLAPGIFMTFMFCITRTVKIIDQKY